MIQLSPPSSKGPKQDDFDVSRLEEKILAIAEVQKSDVYELMGIYWFHERERKPVWWKLFDWNSKTVSELIDDKDCLGGAVLLSQPEQIKKSFLYQYRFDADQDTSILKDKRGKVVGHLGLSVAVEQISKNGILSVKVSEQALKKNGLSHRSDTFLDALEDICERNKGIHTDDWKGVGRKHDPTFCPRDFFNRSVPNITGLVRAPLVRSDEDKLSNVRV